MVAQIEYLGVYDVLSLGADIKNSSVNIDLTQLNISTVWTLDVPPWREPGCIILEVSSKRPTVAPTKFQVEKIIDIWLILDCKC